MLLLTLTISTLFIHVPDKGQIGFIFNSGVKLSYNQYFWMFCEHLIMVILALIIWDESTYRRITQAYLLITIADTVLWVLWYTDPLGNYILTWNILKTVLFVGAIVYEQQLFRNKDSTT
jgi:hypothetical protein